MGRVYHIVDKKLVFMCLVMMIHVSMCAMDHKRKELPKANLDMLERCQYYPRHKPLEFYVARYLINSEKNIENGIFRMHALAFEGDVRAQVFLGLWELKQQQEKLAAAYFNMACKRKHPKAQEELGKLMIEHGRINHGLSLMEDASRPREVRSMMQFGQLLGVFRCYCHKPAIEFMASWHSKSAKT